MARSKVKVTRGVADGSRLPALVTEGAGLLMKLNANGVLTKLGEQLKIRRQGGYCGLDVFIVLLLFMTSGAGLGIRAFWEKIRQHALQLAALGERRRLPTPASLSRALSSVEFDRVRPISSWLLGEATGIDVLLKHSITLTVDACGSGWQVFDLDPTVTTLRQRALPQGEDLPEPFILSEDMGAPGHSGRKRGDIQFRRVTVQHAGSGAWIHAHLSPGNGDGVVDLERALDSVVSTCERIGAVRERVLVRMDGEFGNVPSYTACRARGIPFITRLNRPQLFDDVEVLSRLRSATWLLVEDSGAGPTRSAADVGWISIHPGKSTRCPDGKPYEPLTLRVVASRFPKEGEAKRGKTLDGWQVELFAVDVPADAWPAPDAVAAYFGRSGQENRFAQEDRELGLDRILSYHLPGQELATLVGLFVWNLRLVQGFALAPPPVQSRTPQLQTRKVDERAQANWPRDPILKTLLNQLDWPSLLKEKPGFTWDAQHAHINCGQHRILVITTVRPHEFAPGRAGIIFRRPTGGCRDCDTRPDCLHAKDDDTPKHIELGIPTPIAEKLLHRLALIRGKIPFTTGVAPVTHTAGPRAVSTPLFLPAAARHTFTDLFEAANIRVVVTRPPPQPPGPRLVATDVRTRQRRRLTWEQNRQRFELPEGAAVDVEVTGSNDLMDWIGLPTDAEAGARRRA